MDRMKMSPLSLQERCELLLVTVNQLIPTQKLCEPRLRAV